MRDDIRHAREVSFLKVLDYYGLKGKVERDHVRIPCPFHKETRPSMNISLDKNIFHCFGCGEGGTVIDFVGKMENVVANVAARFILGNFEISSKKSYDLSKFDDKLQTFPDPMVDKKLIEDICSVAVDFFCSVVGEEMNYWKDRGFSVSTIQKAKLGMIRRGLSRILQNDLKISKEKLTEMRLIAPDGNDVGVGRYTIPYFESGKVVNVQTRANKEQESKGVAKYIPLIMHRKVRLYGVDDMKKDYVILTEGAVDCLSLKEHGFNAVGVPGTDTFNSDWLIYFHGVKNIYVCYDTDKAGRKAVQKLTKFFDLIHDVQLPEGVKDVNDYFRSGRTAEDFTKIMKESKEIYGERSYIIPD